MVNAIYVCSICQFTYATKTLAQQCEQFCKKHHSCSLEITKKSLGAVKGR